MSSSRYGHVTDFFGQASETAQCQQRLLASYHYPGAAWLNFRTFAETVLYKNYGCQD
ncbi:MAG: hypothetical protein AAGG02_05975 [Cyanobacteria bacterium P01_H01_bin.15]